MAVAQKTPVAQEGAGSENFLLRKQEFTVLQCGGSTKESQKAKGKSQKAKALADGGYPFRAHRVKRRRRYLYPLNPSCGYWSQEVPVISARGWFAHYGG